MVTLPVYQNKQPIEVLVRDDGAVLDIKEIYHTIQGEGPFVGQPAVFIRLAGCTLQCPRCDTDYTTDRAFVDKESLVNAAKGLAGNKTSLVVITGGEPFRQTIGPLIQSLIDSKPGCHVQIETNGTVMDMGPAMVKLRYHPNLTVICSPKTGVICDAIQPYVNGLKYIIEDGKIDWNDGLPLSSLGLHYKAHRPWPNYYGKIYVQPMDTGEFNSTQKNVEAAVEVCKRFGYTLSLQLHKILGVP